MNTKRLLEIAAHIEAEPDSFAMDEILNPCGTVGCIMGQALMLFEPDAARRSSVVCIAHLRARDLLDLTEREANELFYARSCDTTDDEGEHYKDGYDVIQADYLPLVPDAIRWMVRENKINWRDALDAVTAEALEADRKEFGL